MAFLGGDLREAEAAAYFSALGAKVSLAGTAHTRGLDGASFCAEPGDALQDAWVVVTPVRGIDEEGRIYVEGEQAPLYLTESAIERTHPRSLFVVGKVGGWFRSLAAARGTRYCEILEEEDFAILNSVPTAEGAVKLALEHAPITLAANRSLILGYGRTGTALARVLAGMGSLVTVCTRDPVELVKAEVAGYGTAPLRNLDTVIRDADFIFNTIPAPVLAENILRQARPEVLVIDIASAPGGTDFAACERMGIKSIHALGLPGKVAPRTAGFILARVIERLVGEHFGVS